MMRVSNIKFQISNFKLLEIGNWKLEIPTKQAGFTLIELLASTVVIVTIGVIIIAIIVSALRGTNKTNTISTTRQNGTYAISQLSKMLRFTRSIDALDGDSTKDCITTSPLQQHTSLTFTSIDGGITTISCDEISNRDGAMTIASNSGSLLDTDLVEIPVNKCSLTCSQSTKSDALLVGIKFSLETVRPDGTFFSELTAATDPLEFNTSIILRNVGR